MASIIDKLASPLPLPSILLLSFLTIAGSGCAKDEDTLETRLARANDYFAADQYDKATTEYREVLRLAPTDPVALRRLGIIYHDQGQIVQAYPLLKEATELLPEDFEAQLKFGLTCLLVNLPKPEIQLSKFSTSSLATNKHSCCSQTPPARQPTLSKRSGPSFMIAARRITIAPDIIWRWAHSICGKKKRCELRVSSSER